MPNLCNITFWYFTEFILSQWNFSRYNQTFCTFNVFCTLFSLKVLIFFICPSIPPFSIILFSFLPPLLIVFCLLGKAFILKAYWSTVLNKSLLLLNIFTWLTYSPHLTELSYICVPAFAQGCKHEYLLSWADSIMSNTNSC